MNNRPAKRMLDENNSKEHLAKFQKVLDVVRTNFIHIEKCMEVSKNALIECSCTIDELRSEMIQLECIVNKIHSNDKQQSSGVSKSIQERSRSKKISEQDVIEEITVEGSERPADSSISFGTNSHDDRRKKQRANLEDSDDDEVIYIMDPEVNESGPSRETPKIFKTKQSRTYQKRLSNEKDTLVITEVHPTKNAVLTALEKASGVLPAEELKTFIDLAGTVQDPVQLAKVSFTKDIKMLYLQLTTFHLHLKIENDVAEKEKRYSTADRELENKVQRIINEFLNKI